MSINPLNDISRVYLEQVASQEVEIEEGMTIKDFKANRRNIKRREASADAKKRGHVGKEWYNSGRTYSPDEAKRMRSKLDDEERSTRHRSSIDPEGDDSNYSANKTKNPKKLRKQKAMGELGESSHLEKDMKKRREANEKAVEDMKKTAAYKSMAATAAKKFDEALDPVGKEDADIDNDGKKNTKSDKYLLNRRKVRGQVIAVRKEGFSNWREDLSEVIDKDLKDKKITEKKVNNKILINPKLDLGEAVENLGGTLIEMVEIDEVDYIVESVYDELLNEGYEEDDIEDALEYALTEAKVTFGHDTPTGQKKRGNLLKAVGRLARKKLSSKVRGAKKAAAGAVARGARKVAKGALSVARKMEAGDKKPSRVHSKPGVRTASTYSGAGSGQRERVSSGSYQAPATTKKKAEKPSDPWKGSESVPQKPKPKAKVKPSDPWRGSESVPPKVKAKTKKAAAPKAKATTTPKAKATAAPKRRRKSKLDDLLASVRADESVNLGERTLSSAETKERERIFRSMKSKAPDFEKRYPGRGKEVMYATATKMAKKMSEQAMELQPKTQPVKQEDPKTKVAAQRAKSAEINILQRRLQAIRQTPAGTPVSGIGG